MQKGGGSGRARRKSGLEEARDAFFKHDNFIFHSGGLHRALQQLQGFLNGFMREAESSVVHRDHPAGIQINKGLGGIGRAGMNVPKLLGVVGSDRQQRQLG